MKILEKIKKFYKLLGPGVVTGASDDDPSGVGTYSQTGALFGFSQLWTALFSAPFMIVIQEMCGRIGILTGSGLAGVIKKHYTKKILYACVFLLLIANTINIGADLGAMASSAQLLFGLPFYIWLIFFTVLMLGLEILIPYKQYSKILKYLSFTLFAYVITAFFIKLDWADIAKNTFIPSITFSKDYILNIVAILGTTISPYLFFWECNQEVEEEIENMDLVEDGEKRKKIKKNEIKNMRVDTAIGMIFSQIVMFAIIVTAGSTLFKYGINNITTPDQAALALKPLAGDYAYLLFALGIISTGLLAVPVLATSASYAVSETLGKKVGLSKRFKDVPFFYLVIIVATLFGFILNFIGINPIKALYITAIMNGILAPPLMIMIIRISNNKKIMKSHTNHFIVNILAWVITIFMSGCAILVIFSLFSS